MYELKSIVVTAKTTSRNYNYNNKKSNMNCKRNNKNCNYKNIGKSWSDNLN